MITNVTYQKILGISDKKLDTNKTAQYHLIVQLEGYYFRFCCIDKALDQCVLLYEYLFNEDIKAHDVSSLIEDIYKSEPLLNARYQHVTFCIQTQKYTILPSPLFKSSNTNDYLQLACPVKDKEEVARYFTNSNLQVTIAFSINKKIIDLIQKKHSHTPLRVIHQGNSFITGTYQYLRKKRYPSVLGILITHNYVIFNFVGTQQLYYYNSFRYHSEEELLNCLLVVMQHLKLDPKHQKIVLWGKVDKKINLYKTIRRYMAKVSLGERPYVVKVRYAFKKMAPFAYFDLLSAYYYE